MTGFSRQGRGWTKIGGLAALVLLLVLQLVSADDGGQDVLQQQERQRQIQADTDRMVRQMETTLRVLQFYKMTAGPEKDLLAEAATTLSSLSQHQMNEVLRRLELAAKAPDEKTADQEKAAAYARHREIVSKLKELVGRRDALHSLEEAADRLELKAADQLDQHLATRRLIYSLSNPEPDKRGRRPGPGPRLTIETIMKQPHDRQDDLNRDVTALFEKIQSLEATLPDEGKKRLRMVLADTKQLGVLANMKQTAEEFLLTRSNYQTPIELQMRCAENLQQLARELRTPQDKIAALREARQHIDQTLKSQQEVRQQTEDLPDPKTRQELNNQESKLAFQTRDISNLLRTPAAKLADKVSAAEKKMQDAIKQMSERTTESSVASQKQAEKELIEVRNALSEAIAKAEQDKKDPLASLKKALEQVDTLLAEQKEMRDRTTAAESNKKTEQLPKEAKKQQDLAKRTEEVMQQGMASKPETKPTLDQAAKAMQQAAKALENKQTSEAAPKQEEAIKSLEAARGQLEEKIAEAEKRQAEIAKLEKAAERVADLANQEKAVAEKAREMAGMEQTPQTNDLAKKQEELTPQTREIAKMVEQANPEAAKKLEETTKKMEDAKANLDNKQLPPAAKKAEEAVQKLEEAGKMIAKTLEEKRTEETIDEAKENSMEAAKAAQQVAKALEKTQEARNEAKKAADPMKGDPMQNNKVPLAELQKEIAKQADKLKVPEEGVKAAEAAAEALQKGDLPMAIQQQEEALKHLLQAANKEAEPKQEENVGQLAQSQNALLEATKALQKSKKANAAAQAAVAQAQAQAPPAVQPGLGKAAQQLAQAGKELGQGQPGQAGQAQDQAISQLGQALDALNAAAAATGQAQAQPGQSPMAQASGMEPGMGKGEEPGMGTEPGMGKEPGQAPGEGQSEKPGTSQEQNTSKGNGQRTPDGKLKNSPSKLTENKGEESFINLPQRQRDMIRQALNGELPPEYSSMIKQYYINLAKTRPTTAPSGR
jgi:hypothetical protein